MATYTVTVSDTDESILKNDLVDQDEWIQAAVNGKINNCWKRMHRNWTDKLTNDETFTNLLPSNKADFIALVIARDDYKTAAEIKAEDDAKIPKG